MDTPNKFMVTRVFNAPIEKVWRAWTDPHEVKKWWGPEGWTAPQVNIDFRAGGKYLLCMRGAMTPGGEEKDFWSTGIYQEIVPMEKIVATDSFSDPEGNVVPASYYGMSAKWPLELRVETMFEKIDENKTKLTISYPDLADTQDKDLKDMRQGWNQSLNKLAKAVETK